MTPSGNARTAPPSAGAALLFAVTVSLAAAGLGYLKLDKYVDQQRVAGLAALAVPTLAFLYGLLLAGRSRPGRAITVLSVASLVGVVVVGSFVGGADAGFPVLREHARAVELPNGYLLGETDERGDRPCDDFASCPHVHATYLTAEIVDNPGRVVVNAMLRAGWTAEDEGGTLRVGRRAFLKKDRVHAEVTETAGQSSVVIVFSTRAAPR